MTDDDASEDFDEDIIDDDEQDLSDIDLADIDDEDLSDIEFNDESEDENNTTSNKLVSHLNEKLKLKNTDSKSKEKKKGKEMDNIFVSAEKFAEMLEEQSKTKNKHGGSNALNISDGASAKQIDWEMKRNQKFRRSFGKNKRKFTQRSDRDKGTKRFKR